MIIREGQRWYPCNDLWRKFCCCRLCRYGNQDDDLDHDLNDDDDGDDDGDDDDDDDGNDFAN